MNSKKQYERDLRIENPLGFHVRPVQRFAELAQAFEADITVEIGGKEVSGKSVMGLMSLGGRCGATMSIKTRGEDARQAMDVISYLVNEDFFVEDEVDTDVMPRRHIERLKSFVSCFKSDTTLVLDGKELSINSPEDFEDLEFQPDEDVDFIVEGEDSEQASKVLQKLSDYKFYVEDVMKATY